MLPVRAATASQGFLYEFARPPFWAVQAVLQPGAPEKTACQNRIVAKQPRKAFKTLREVYLTLHEPLERNEHDCRKNRKQGKNEQLGHHERPDTHNNFVHFYFGNAADDI